MAYLSYSTYFNGSATLTTPSSSAFSFGTGNFTIEFWIKAASQASFIYDNRGGSTGGNPHITLETTILRWGGTDLRGTIVIADNNWHHCAITRQSDTVKLWVDGVLDNSGADSTNYNTDQPIRIGTNSFGGGMSSPITGYFSNFRIVKGTAVYTSAFTPPTIPLSIISGVSLLTCRSATTFDFSTNNFSITTTGSTAIDNTNTPFSVASAVPPTTYFRQIPTVSSTTKQTTELTSLDSTTINTSSLSIQIPNQKYIPTVASTTKQTTELTSLDSTNNYSVTVSANLVGKKEIPTVPSVTRFSTFIKTSNDPIVDAAAGATISQTWTIS
jgi:hypothetical protein